jgi:hypothetical protein
VRVPASRSCLEDRIGRKAKRCGSDSRLGAAFDAMGAWTGTPENAGSRCVPPCSAATQYVFPLTALLNLDWQHSADEKAIPEKDLADGWERYVWPLLQDIRPRLVCPFTKNVWDNVIGTVASHRIEFPTSPFLDSLAPRQPVVFQLPGCDFPSMLLKPHNHPSRPITTDQIAEVGRACQWFVRASA